MLLFAIFKDDLHNLDFEEGELDENEVRRAVRYGRNRTELCIKMEGGAQSSRITKGLTND